MIIPGSQIDTITVAGRVFTNLTNLIILYARMSSGAAENYSTMRTAAGSSGYTPSGSKAFKMSAIKTMNYAPTTTAMLLGIVQSNNDVGMSSATVPTGQVFPTGGAGNLAIQCSGTSGVTIEETADFQIANTKFLSLIAPAQVDDALVKVYGYEV